LRAVVQRVHGANVEVYGSVVGTIGTGLLVLLGCGHEDDSSDAEYIAKKIAELRIFEDDDGKMNLSVEDIEGSVLVVSQFTLYGDCRKGRRPSFVQAMEPGRAEQLVEEVVSLLRTRGLPVETGRFGADMDVHLVNNGPVTLLLQSKRDL